MTVSGRVQGVGFRMSARDEAFRLGLTGWVRNRSSGDVELVAEGNPANIEAFESWCRCGPPYALVNNVAASRGAATGEFDRFNIL